MITLHRSLVPALVTTFALVGCIDQPEADTAAADEPAAAAAPAAVAAAAADAAVRVEQAERSLDLGRDLTAARATLEAVVADKSAPADVRDRAALSLSRAAELARDTEGAVRAIENLLAAHDGDRAWSGQEGANRRLRKLLTGKEEGPPSTRRAPEKVPPFAHVLAGYYAPKKDVPVEMRLVVLGGNGDVSERLGTFNVRDAINAKAQEACPLCDVNVNVRSSIVQNSSWTAIPAMKSRLDGAINVFYTHLADPIPARYDSLLPASMVEVTAHLQKGEAVIVARERPGMPPSILLAAPREAQLADVEEALSMMKTLPTSLTVISVPPSLKTEEIRTVVRADGMPTFKKCYDELLTRVPAAAGSVDIGFAIRADGTVENAQLDTSPDLTDTVFSHCIIRKTNGLAFPATGTTTTVKYPFTFSP